MLLDFMPGSTLESLWRTSPMSRKQEMFEHRFQSVGNLYKKSEQSSFEVGPIVSLHFFWGNRGERDIQRGPFKNSFEWLTTRLHLVLEDQQNILEKSEDEGDIEDAQTSKSLAEQLLHILPDIFSEDGNEETIVFYDDLSMHNILADAESLVAGIIDWECVSALPLWKACRYPEFLNDRTRNEEPLIADYGTEELYWEHLFEYERGQLRQAFLTEMERLRPEWAEEYSKGKLKQDFERDVSNCDTGWSFKQVQAWLNAYNEGRPASLEELLLE
jgi:hypothetical protein